MGVSSSSEHANAYNTSLDAARKSFTKGNDKFNLSDYNGAKMSYRKALNLLKMHDETHHHATAMSNIACLEYAEGRFYEAQKLFEDALKIRREVKSNSEEEKDQGQASIKHLLLCIQKDKLNQQIKDSRKNMDKIECKTFFCPSCKASSYGSHIINSPFPILPNAIHAS
jgi:tetratricopeptide (TPR) repeat protein